MKRNGVVRRRGKKSYRNLDLARTIADSHARLYASVPWSTFDSQFGGDSWGLTLKLDGTADGGCIPVNLKAELERDWWWGQREGRALLDILPFRRER